MKGLKDPDVIKKLRQYFDQQNLKLKVYKTGRTGIRMVQLHKEDALKDFIERNDAPEEKVLIMADSARTDQMDRELLSHFTKAMSVNLGKTSETFSKKSAPVLQMTTPFRGPEGALKILRSLLQNGYVSDAIEGMAVPDTRILEDAAMRTKGGIDFNLQNMDLMLNEVLMGLNFTSTLPSWQRCKTLLDLYR